MATRGHTLALPHGLEPQAAAPPRTLAELERDQILETLREVNWVVGGWNGAAVRLGLSRTALIARMQRLGISRRQAAPTASGMSSRQVPGDGQRAELNSAAE